MELKFDEKGLIPAIVQDHYTKEVLTLAYMNAETLALTIAEGRTLHWKVEKTFVNGHLLYNNGEIDDTYRGQELRFR